MKRLLLLVGLILLLAGCGDDDQVDAVEEPNETEAVEDTAESERMNNALDIMNENIDEMLALDSLYRVWHIEDHFSNGDELDEDMLFRFTDDYIMDEEKSESLNSYEQGLTVQTGTMITKTIGEEYEDEEEFQEDLDEYYDVLENGSELFSD